MHQRPKRFSKAQKKRNQIEQAAELARADERAKAQKVQKPSHGQHKGASRKGAGRGNAAIPTWVHSGWRQREHLLLDQHARWLCTRVSWRSLRA